MNKQIAIGLLILGLALLASPQATTAAPSTIYINAHTFKPLTNDQVTAWLTYEEHGSVISPSKTLASTSTAKTLKFSTPSWAIPPNECNTAILDWQGNPLKGYLHYDWWTNTTSCYPYVSRHGAKPKVNATT